MKVVDVAQGSVAWLEARAGIPTASEFDQLITPKGEIRKGEMPKTYLAKKLAERWGGPLPQFTGFAAEQGSILEGEALPWMEFEFGWKAQRPGLLTTDDGLIGCSPDAMVPGQFGVEIKCPEAPTHVKYLLAGKLPTDYIAQVQGGLYVTGLPYWQFISYRRMYPALVLEISPDEQVQAALSEALDQFVDDLEAAWERLCELNGGPPPKREPMIFSDEWKEESETVGITP